MSTEKNENQDQKPQIDPFVASIAASFGKVLDPTVEPTNDEPTVPMPPVVPLSEIVAHQRSIAPEEKKEEPKPEEKEPAPEQKPEEKPKETPAEKKEEGPKPIKLRKRVEKPVETKAVEKEEPPPAPQTPPDDQAYIATLTPDQQEELNLASYAESKGRKNIYSDTLSYFKKVDEWIQKNPDVGTDSTEFREFCDANKPKWTELDRKRIERQMIADEVRRELRPEIEEHARKVKAIEARPVVEEALTEFDSAITGKPPADGLESVDKEVLQAIQSEGYEKALEKFPIEAPIVQGTRQAVQSYMELASGVAKLDPENNPMHAWIVRFLGEEGVNMANQPKEKRIRDGKDFLPMHEYRKLLKEKPSEAAKFYTFDDEMIVGMLADRAVLSINNEIKRLERSGFKRERRKVSETTGNTGMQQTSSSTQSSESSGSPRASSRGVPGAMETSKTNNEALSFISQLHPDAARVLAGS